MQNPAHDAMVGRLGWFDDSQESRVFLPRRGYGESLVAVPMRGEFPTGSVRARLLEFSPDTRAPPDFPATQNSSSANDTLCSVNHWLPKWCAIGNNSEWLTALLDKE
jgi:hypothetical protein